MKTILKFLVLIFAVLIVSCKESTDMLTVVKPDGSCYRVFNKTADNEFLLGDKSIDHNSFPVEIDSTWQIYWRYKDTGIRTDFPLSRKILDSLNIQSSTSKIEGQKIKSDVLVFIRKDFESPEQMDTLFKWKENHSWKDLKVKHQLDKKFGWFYTYYKYTETYPKIETPVEVPITDYLTNVEIMYWFTGQPDILKGMNGIEARDYLGRLEDKYNQWFASNAWKAEFKILLANYKLIKKPPVNYEVFSGLRDSIFNSKVKNYPDFKMEQILRDFFKSDVYSDLWKTENSPMKQFEEEFYSKAMQYLENSFNYKLIMPGTITNPGNAVVRGDTLTWNLTAYRMFPADYVIQAESRKANVWTFLLTGLILIVAIGSFIWKGKK